MIDYLDPYLLVSKRLLGASGSISDNASIAVYVASVYPGHYFTLRSLLIVYSLIINLRCKIGVGVERQCVRETFFSQFTS